VKDDDDNEGKLITFFSYFKCLIKHIILTVYRNRGSTDQLLQQVNK